MLEEPLDGGLTNHGAVVRQGDHVLRPSTPYTTSIHRFLRAVRAAGFDGAPMPVGIDRNGRDRLEFVDGDVPHAPYPDWSQGDAALTSIARLLRRLHDGSRYFDPSGLDWDDTLADPVGGSVVCHNDVELSNVVFEGGRAVALIDFEFSAPGRPVYDVAQFARLCVPIEDEVDQKRMGWKPADRPARLRLIADAYGLTKPERAQLLGAIDDAVDRIERTARSKVDGAGLEQTGGIEKYDRRRQWWQRHRQEFADVLS